MTKKKEVNICDIEHINRIVESETRLGKKEHLVKFYVGQLKRAGYDFNTRFAFVEHHRKNVKKNSKYIHAWDFLAELEHLRCDLTIDKIRGE